MVNESEIRLFLEERNLGYTENGTQFVLDCPVCGKEQKVYMGKNNGIWDCKSCGFKSNFWKYQNVQPQQDVSAVLTLKTLDRYEALLKGDLHSQNYLEKRGLTGATVLAERIATNDKGDIVLPYFDKQGNLTAFKYRNLRYEDYLSKYEQDKSNGLEAKKPAKWYSVGKTGLWRANKIDFSKPVFITEGEWDCLIALQYGISNAGAAPGCTNKTWVELLKDTPEIYICFDTDGAGIEGAFELASRLGLDRCYNVDLTKLGADIKDINEAWNKGISKEQFQKLVETSHKFPVAGMSKSDRFADVVLDELLSPEKLKGIPTGYINLDHLTGGYSGQELRIVSGLTSTGKTTWIMNEMLIYAKQNIPVAIFSLESPVKKVMKDMLQQLSDRPLATLNKEELVKLIHRLNELPIYWFDSRNFEDNFSITKFKQLVRQTRDRYGVKFVVLDDLDFLITASPKNQTETEVVSNLMTELKTMANNLNVHQIVLAHIVKGVGEGIPRMKDIRGSGAISQRADYVVIIHRETAPDADEELKADVVMAIEKNRLRGDTGIVRFHYDKLSKLYREV